MNESISYRFIFSGGGTGGHIFPAIAVANGIKNKLPEAQILFVGAKGKMEMTKVPQAGFEIIGLWIGGLQRKLDIRNFILPFKVISSLWKARKILKSFKPDVVVGFGGYASVPILYMANRLGIPTAIQEQNSYAGIANKLLSKNARKIFVAFEGMEKYFGEEKIVIAGNPVRSDISNSNRKRVDGIEYFELSPSKRTVLVLGGSLGARQINESIVEGLDKVVKNSFQVIWQTGKLYIDEMTERAKAISSEYLKIHEFIEKMDLAYAVSDIIISRAGALSIAELTLLGKPVIFVPSPNVAEDHQTKNADYLVKRDAALVITDKEAPMKLVDEALKLLSNNERQVRLGENLALLGKPEATNEIVDEILQMIK